MPNTKLSSVRIHSTVCNTVSLSTDDDVRVLERLREEGIAEPFDVDRQHLNICWSGCSDGHRPHMWLMHLPACLPENGGCFHPFLDHANTLRMAIGYPNTPWEVCIDKIDQIGLAFSQVKRGILTQTLLTSHYPCFGASMAGADMLTALVWASCAKRHVRIRRSGLPEIALLHKLDTPDGNCLTDKITLRLYIDWIIRTNHPAQTIWETHEQRLREMYPESFHHLT